MPRFVKSRRSAPPAVQPGAAQPVEEPPAARAAANAPAVPTQVPVLRVGEYQIGEVFCPHLCGHPDIRY